MRFLAGFLAFISLMGVALAADTRGPDAVVTEMYQTYFDALNKADATGAMDDMPDVLTQAGKYATPELAARLKKAESSEEPVIDWDFLVDGQDYKDLKLLSVKVTDSKPEAATVRVGTSNMGQASETDVLMVKTADGWRVSDFVFWPGKAESLTLSGVLKEGGL